MNFLVLNRDLVGCAMVDEYESMIWTDRYNEAGDFTLVIPAASKVLKSLKLNRYLVNPKSDRLMIIEEVDIDTSAEEGDKATIIGRSLESILSRRIVWKKTEIKDMYVQDVIKKLVDDAIIAPEDEKRKISNFALELSDDETLKTDDYKMNTSYDGENLYDVVVDICTLYDLGWRVVNKDDKFIMQIYKGRDFSYDQDSAPYIVFSTKFENLLSTNYVTRNVNLMTAARVRSRDDSTLGVVEAEAYGNENPEGLDRREMLFDSDTELSDEEMDKIPTEDDDPEGRKQAIKDAQEKLKPMLTEDGETEIAKTSITKAFDGELAQTNQYVYGEDFLLGDIVQVENAYGISDKCRVSELIYSHDPSSETLYPSFTSFFTSEDMQDLDDEKEEDKEDLQKPPEEDKDGEKSIFLERRTYPWR